MGSIDVFRRNFDFLIQSEAGKNSDLWSEMHQMAEYSLDHDPPVMVIAWVGQMVVSLVAYHRMYPNDKTAGAVMQSVVDMFGGYLAELAGWARYQKRNGAWIAIPRRTKEDQV